MNLSKHEIVLLRSLSDEMPTELDPTEFVASLTLFENSFITLMADWDRVKTLATITSSGKALLKSLDA